jgi:hypothetical protein
LLGGSVEEVPDAARSASPIVHVDPSDPPFYFTEVPSALLTVEGDGHGDFFRPDIDDRVRRALDHWLRGVGDAPESETVRHPPESDPTAAG